MGLGILAGCRRFAHLTALRFDAVATGLLGVRALVSEDSVRPALYRLEPVTAGCAGSSTWSSRSCSASLGCRIHEQGRRPSHEFASGPHQTDPDPTAASAAGG